MLSPRVWEKTSLGWLSSSNDSLDVTWSYRTKGTLDKVLEIPWKTYASGSTCLGGRMLRKRDIISTKNGSCACKCDTLNSIVFGR